jgi:hypothetical protein
MLSFPSVNDRVTSDPLLKNELWIRNRLPDKQSSELSSMSTDINKNSPAYFLL